MWFTACKMMKGTGMKKIGILTLHYSDNYGAVLQCFALRTAINRIPNCSAEIINFNPGRKYGWFTDERLQQKFLLKLKKYEEFNETENGIITDVIYDKNEIDQENYDYYIVGSDQVWNTSFSFFDTAYLLDFVKGNAKRISYAASVGLAVDSPCMRKEVFEANIPYFDFLSVREKTHEKFIASFTDKKVQTVVDPTLLLTSADYDRLITDTEKERSEEGEGDYIFFYYLKHDSTTPLACSFVNMLARKYNLKIIHYYVETPEIAFKNESKSFYFDGPKDFVWYIKHAKIVVTNSFHGTVFSILYHKPFYTYVVKSMGARVLDLLHNLGLENRILHGYMPLQEVSFIIDYSSVDKILGEERQKSLEYLYTALGERESE